MENLLVVGIGIGLASIAGVRAFLPLALFGLFARFGLVGLPEFGLFGFPDPFDLLGDWLVIGVLLALALLESALDKAPALERGLNLAMIPVRAGAGAVLFSAALGAGLGTEAVPELAAGGVIAGAVAVLNVLLRPSAKIAAAGVSASFLSASEDVVALVGGIVAVLVPLVPLLFVAFLLFFFFRVRRRRGRQYAGLRILRD